MELFYSIFPYTPVVKRYKYPYHSTDFKDLIDYVKQLSEFASKQPTNYLKVCTVNTHVSPVLLVFIEDYNLYYDITSDNFPFCIFMQHIHMELRRKRSHLNYRNPKHRIRLHSITNFCSCLYCRHLFRHVPCPWPDLAISLALYPSRTHHHHNHPLRNSTDVTFIQGQQ